MWVAELPAFPSRKHVRVVYTPVNPTFISKKKTGVCRGISTFLIFAPKHRLWVHVRTASPKKLKKSLYEHGQVFVMSEKAAPNVFHIMFVHNLIATYVLLFSIWGFKGLHMTFGIDCVLVFRLFK